MLPFSDACERNKGPILEVLRRHFSHTRDVLEIGSGTGQHAVHFAKNLPHVKWHPTEQSIYLDDLRARIDAEGTGNIERPAQLDVRQRVWPLAAIDGVFTANTLHIVSWRSVQDLFAGIGRVLLPAGMVCVYGPFRYAGRYTSASNEAFDGMLRARDPDSGIRDAEAVLELAASHGLALLEDHDLPAYNRCLVWCRRP